MIPPFQVRNRRSIRLMAACASLFLAAACGDTPTSPSETFAGASGAVIEGTVTGGAGSSSPSDLAGVVASAATPSTVASATVPSGLRVRVADTGLSAPVDEHGKFRLTDVPSGRVRLQFQADTVNATTELSNVSGNQVIVVQVQVSATSAVIINEVREGKVVMCHAESGSRYHPIAISESAEPAHRAHGDGEVGDPVPGRANMTFGESCELLGPAVEIEKSTNGQEADSAPGPEVEVGEPVTWTYVVKNVGTVNLTNVAVTDDRSVVVDCKGITTLAAGASMTCTGVGVATLGQYLNVGTVSANWTSSTGVRTLTASDASHYFGVLPDDDEGGGKVTLCHRTGNDRYVKIEVDQSAEPAHRAHGDAKVGEAVPGLAGKAFSAACVPQ